MQLTIVNMPENIPPFKTVSTNVATASWQPENIFTSNPIVFSGGTITTKKEIIETNSSQAFCLRWNNYQFNLMSVFDQMLQNELFVDVTLACEGSLIKAHKMVLSACSPFFQTIFIDNPCEHPVVIMKDVRLIELKAIVEFMYKGEINVVQDQIGPLLRVAETLKIRGLADVSDSSGKSSASTEIPGVNAIVNDNQLNVNLTDDADQLGTVLNCVQPVESTISPKTPKKNLRNLGKRKTDVDTGNSRLKRTKTTKTSAIGTTAKRKKKKCESTICQDELIGQIKDETNISLTSNNEDDNKSTQPWLEPSTSKKQIDYEEIHDNISDKSITNLLKLKAPSWTPAQLREAISSVVTQKMRFTQASLRYNIPKGTLYDNILGKSNRMDVLEKSGLDASDENSVLEFCCDLSVSPYNRRTRKPLQDILQFVFSKANCNRAVFDESGKFAFRWWWAFCKKYSIASMHYDGNANLKKIRTE